RKTRRSIVNRRRSAHKLGGGSASVGLLVHGAYFLGPLRERRRARCYEHKPIGRSIGFATETRSRRGRPCTGRAWRRGRAEGSGRILAQRRAVPNRPRIARADAVRKRSDNQFDPPNSKVRCLTKLVFLLYTQSLET